MTDRELIANAFVAYNRQDVDALLEMLADDVDWANGSERLVGKPALRQYWRDQFTVTRTHDVPVRFIDLPPDRTAVHLEQTVRDRQGSLLSRGRLRYSFVVRDGLVSRLDTSRVTTLGLIGGGEIGSTLAGLAVGAGYDVVLSNSRGPDTLETLVRELGPTARAATVEDAATAGDVVVVAISLGAYRAVPAGPVAGKVVVDTSNYVPDRDGVFPALEAATTTSEMLQRHLPAASVVKAFNNIGAGELARQGQPTGSPGRRALAMAGDSAAAKRTVGVLIDELGYDAVDVGPLSEGWRYQRDTPAWAGRRIVEELRTALARARRHSERDSAGAEDPRTQNPRTSGVNVGSLGGRAEALHRGLGQP